MFSLFRDGPEYKKRMATPFTPTKVRVLFTLALSWNS